MRFSPRPGVGEAKLCRPAMHGFIRGIDATLGRQFFNASQAQGKTEVQPDGLLDDLGWKWAAASRDTPHWH